MAFTVTVIEKTKFKIYDANDSFIGERVQGIANVLLDDYLEHYGLTLDADAFGLNSLVQLFVQPLDVNQSQATLFDWDPTTGTLMAVDSTDGTAIADDGLATLNARVIFIGT
jgi:hypothetical protein